jgi:hypothetical protein
MGESRLLVPVPELLLVRHSVHEVRHHVHNGRFGPCMDDNATTLVSVHRVNLTSAG